MSLRTIPRSELISEGRLNHVGEPTQLVYSPAPGEQQYVQAPVQLARPVATEALYAQPINDWQMAPGSYTREGPGMGPRFRETVYVEEPIYMEERAGSLFNTYWVQPIDDWVARPLGERLGDGVKYLADSVFGRGEQEIQDSRAARMEFIHQGQEFYEARGPNNFKTLPVLSYQPELPVYYSPQAQSTVPLTTNDLQRNQLPQTWQIPSTNRGIEPEVVFSPLVSPRIEYVATSPVEYATDGVSIRSRPERRLVGVYGA